MDLNGPGTSLFQGNDLSNFNNLEQREEEEEALEEQRRRDLELKNELENAFDDVSFDNDEESLCNGSENRLSSANSSVPNKSHQEVDTYIFKETAQNKPIDENMNSPSCHTEGFSTPLKHIIRASRNDFSNECENYSDECRKKIQNGSLHDIVDQSGGGDQTIQALLHYNHCFPKNSMSEAICNGQSNNINPNVMLKTNFIEKAEDSSEQLKILYDVRVREVHRLTELVDSIKNKHTVELKDLKHQLALMMAEKERTNISHSQLQSLLVDCKQQIEHLVNDVNALEKAKKELESSNKELIIELDSAKLTVDDLQRKILVLEKGSRCKSELEQYELKLKSLTEKHNMEVLNMKKELDNYVKNYGTLLKENEELKLKAVSLSQINDENLSKKSEIISRLSQQIEESQKQCENLMKLSTTEDNFRLQAELKIIKEEKLQLMLKIENLEKEKSRQEEELKQYESLNRMWIFNSNNSDFKGFDGSEVNGKLGAELYRALSSQKAKRLEIKNLQVLLNDKNEQIQLFIENEKTLHTEIGNLKEEIETHLRKLKDQENLIFHKEEKNKILQNSVDELQEKLDIYEINFQSKCEQLEKDNKLLKNEITSLEKEKAESISNFSEKYLTFHSEDLERMREEIENYFKLEILKKDLENENLKKEIEELKNLYVEVRNAKENTELQLEKEKNSLGHGSAVDLEEVKKLQKELEKSRHRILELDQTLKHQYEQEVEILNLDINQLKLQLEKLKKEKEREIAERDKILVENELLKTEVEQVTSEKNLLFLSYEKLFKEANDVRDSLEKIKEDSENEIKKLIEMHSLELQNLSNKYEITIKKLTKEIELSVTKAVKYESKHTSPIKNLWVKNAAIQQCSSNSVNKSTSPICSPSSPELAFKPVASVVATHVSKDIGVLTDPESDKISKKEVVEIMKKLGVHHEQEIIALEKKYFADFLKLEKKFHMEIDKAKEIIHQKLRKKYELELEQLEEKHRIEMENRIEQEKNEAVADLITEWACEVQSLKVSYAESQAEMEKVKMKYKAAKNIALQYKTYFKSKAEHMKGEWKKIEDGYERALKELEKNVHILVDVKEDEVKAKVDSITKLYEQKISKMKEKLLRCENKLKVEKDIETKKEEISKSEKTNFRKDLERLSVPNENLYWRLCLPQKKNLKETNRKFYDSNDQEKEEAGFFLKQIDKDEVGEEKDKLKSHKKKQQQNSEVQNTKERTNR